MRQKIAIFVQKTVIFYHTSSKARCANLYFQNAFWLTNNGLIDYCTRSFSLKQSKYIYGEEGDITSQEDAVQNFIDSNDMITW
jgi:hypothetical protein